MNGLRFLLGDTANPDKIVSKWNMLEEKATYLVNNLFGIEINNDIKSIVLEINKKFHKEKELNIDNYKKTEENELIIDFGAIEQDRELSHLICLSIAAGLPGQLFEIAAEHSGEIIRESENIDKITFIGNSAAGAIAQYAYVSTGTGPGKQCVTLNSVGIKRFTEFNGNEFFGYPLAFDYFLSDLFRIDNNMRYLLVELEKYGVLEDGNISYRFRKDYGKKIDRERILFVLVNILMSKSDAEKEEIQELVENLFDPLIVERKMLFIDRYRDYIVKRDKDTIINYVMSDNIPALMYGHIGGTYIVDKDMNKYNPGLTDEVLGKIERLDQDKLELLTESNSEIFQPFILRKEKGNGDRTVNRFGQTPEINQMTNNLSLDYLSALIKDIIRDLHNKDNNILKCLFKSSRLDHGSEFIEIIKDRLRHSMLLQGKIPGSDDIYKSSYFKENPGLLTEQDKVYSLAGPAVRQLERMSDHDIRKLFKWELTGEGIFLILCGKEESEDENSGKQDDSIIEYHGSDSKQKFDNSEERLKLECNEPSRNRIYGSSRQGRYIEELDNEYLLKDEDAYQFNNSQGAGFEILSENTSPERKIKIDGRDISIEYQEKDREEADIGNREKLLSHTYFGENIILKDKRKIYGELSGELIYIYGPGKKDQLTIEGFVNGDYGITLVEKYREKEEKEEYITYTDFRIRLDCIELIALKEFQIEKSTHDHTRVRIKGVIREEDAEKYEKYLMKEDPEIQITYGEDDSKVLFKGIVSNYDLSFNNFDYFLELEAVSYSILLDREKRTVVYQNLNTSYNEVLSMINRRYDNINISFAHSSGGEVPLVSEEFPVVIQYKETDWEFLKRISSYLNKALIIDDCKDLNETINIQLGFHRGSARPLENVAWSECKETGPGNTEYNYYRVSGHQYYRTEEVFAAGQKVSLNIDYEEEQQVEMGIIRTRIYVEEDILYTDLVLCREEDINMLKYQRENFMEGRSFRAEVMKLNDRHQAKVKFIDIEDEFKEAQAFWFPIDRSYTESYIAPEVGEIVDVYLKDRNERQAGIRSNYRREEEAEPSDKIITTPGEYVLKLNNESIYIRSKEKETELEILEDRIKIKSSDNKGFIEKDEIDLEGKKGQILLNNSVSDLKFNSRELEIKGGKISMK